MSDQQTLIRYGRSLKLRESTMRRLAWYMGETWDARVNDAISTHEELANLLGDYWDEKLTWDDNLTRLARTLKAGREREAEGETIGRDGDEDEKEPHDE